MMSKHSTPPGRIDVEVQGKVLIARIDGGPLAELGPEVAVALSELMDRVEDNPDIRAVVLTGTHPGRFISHANIPWMNDGGRKALPVGRGISSILARLASVFRLGPTLSPGWSRVPFAGVVQLDQLHHTFLRMNRSGAIFIAALNGSAQGIGSELVQACDVRLMADGDFFIGQFEILIGFNPGGGGTQRLSRLVGPHRALRLMLEGRPVKPAEALEIGLVDEVLPAEQLLQRAVALGEYLGSRPSLAVEAVKRSVYFGASLPLEQGLHLERAEMISLLTKQQAQALMADYIRDTEQNGELPLYVPESYAAALASGSFASQR